jgi:hypothetical protein
VRFMAHAQARGSNRHIVVNPLLLQGAYYIATGLWPIVHLRSFMAATGPKRDTWLVQTFGALVAAVGMSLVRTRAHPSTGASLSVACALALSASELIFVAKGRIRSIYAIDAAVELSFAAGAIIARPSRRGEISMASRVSRADRTLRITDLSAPTP